MWKKPEAKVSSSPATPAPRPEAGRADPRSARSRIGSGISVKGELRGEEDVVIEGRVEGVVAVERNVVVGESGQVDADISGGTISVAGKVRGNLEATEKVVLLETARVEGNITAKSVTIETGAGFRGSVEMEVVGSSRSKSLAQPVVPGGPAGKGDESRTVNAG